MYFQANCEILQCVYIYILEKPTPFNIDQEHSEEVSVLGCGRSAVIVGGFLGRLK